MDNSNLESLSEKTRNCLLGHKDCICQLVITSDNKHLNSGSDDKTVRIWNLLENKQEIIFKGHTKGILQIAISSDNKYIISSSLDKRIRIWNLKKRRIRCILKAVQIL